MRILQATNYQPPHMGGIEYAAQSLKICWEKRGHDVTWITTDVPRNARPAAEDNIRIPALNVLEDWFELNTPLISPLHYRRISKVVREHDAVIAHSLAPGLSIVVLHAALRQGIPVAVTQHVGIVPMPGKLRQFAQEGFLKRAAPWAVNHGAKLTFVGKAVRNWFLEHAGIAQDAVTMTPAGIDQAKFFFVPEDERSSYREKWDLRKEALNVLFVGRLYEKKGVHLIRDVAAGNPSVQFTLVGKGPMDPNSWDLDNVRVISYVSTEDLRELYGAHDLFLLPSTGEGWPAVVPQAMACGLTCLISPEAFAGYAEDEERFIVCPREVSRMNEQLKAVAEKGYPAASQREATADYAKTHWNWEESAEIYLKLVT